MQVQSTWFPLYDRNPQKFVPNIFDARNRIIRRRRKVLDERTSFERGSFSGAERQRRDVLI